QPDHVAQQSLVKFVFMGDGHDFEISVVIGDPQMPSHQVLKEEFVGVPRNAMQKLARFRFGKLGNHGMPRLSANWCYYTALGSDVQRFSALGLRQVAVGR